MSIFNELETAANDHIITGDNRECALFRLNAGSDGKNDGFHKELEHHLEYDRQITVAISRAANGFIGTTRDTDIRVNDVIQWIDARNEVVRWTVTAFEPTDEHTLLTMEGVESEN